MTLFILLELDVVIHGTVYFTLNGVNSQNIPHTPVVDCKYQSCTEIETTQKLLLESLFLNHRLFPPIDCR